MSDTLETILPTYLASAGIGPGTLAVVTVALFSFAAGLIVARRRRVAEESECTPVIPSFRRSRAAFTSELDRVRRYDHPLAVVVLKLEDVQTEAGSLGLLPTNGSAPDEAHAAMLRAGRQVMFWNLGYALLDLLREGDLTACDLENRRYIVLLPESGEEDAVRAAKRIEQRVLEGVGVALRKGVAVYRSDGLTIDDLVTAATAKCDRAAAAPPVVRAARRGRLRFRRIADSRS